MILDPQLCTGCGLCLKICPGQAISLVDRNSLPLPPGDAGGNGSDAPAPDGVKLSKRVALIDEGLCFECGACLRSAVCHFDAFREEDSLPWPRSMRKILSDPLTMFEDTRITGRGTEEMKTNDVAGRFVEGELGVAIDVGRPNVGTYMRDVDTIASALAKLGVRFAKENPVTALMDIDTGHLSEEVLNERVISAIIEFFIKPQQLPEVIEVLREVGKKIDTVFSVGVISKVNTEEGGAQFLQEVRGLGVEPLANVKTNIGLGRAK